MLYKVLLAILAFSFTITPILNAQDDVLTVRYLPPEEETGSRSQYYAKLLELALEKTVDTHGPYKMVPADRALNQRDALKAMMQNEGLDIVHTMTDKTRERVLLPVRVPLVKGLIGVRMLLINKEEEQRFQGVSSIEDLSNYTFGQGYDWPDTEILRYNDLNVETSQEYQALFTMLDNGVIDAFPRAVFEVYNEIIQHKKMGLTTAEGFYIYYPSALYFFVRKDVQGGKLQKRVQAGLLEAIDDGSFDKLFNAQMMEYLKRADLNSRVGIKLKNPLLPEDTPVDNNNLWYINF